jgi:HEAT repeat protein
MKLGAPTLAFCFALLSPCVLIAQEPKTEIDRLRRSLASGSPEDRAQAIAELQRWADRDGAVELLSRAMAGPRPIEAAVDLVRALAGFGEKGLCRLVVQLGDLRDHALAEDDAVLTEARRVLSVGEALPCLVTAVRDPAQKSRVQREAARLLEMMGARPDLVQMYRLRSALESTSPESRAQAIGELQGWADKDGALELLSEGLDRRPNTEAGIDLVRALAGFGEKGLCRLVTRLGSMYGDTLAEASRALADHREAGACLTTAARDPAGESSARREAMRLLEKMDASPDLVPEMIKDPDAGIRLEALQLLAKRNDGRFSDVLVAALDDPDLQVATTAAEELGKLGRPSDAWVVPVLVKAALEAVSGAPRFGGSSYRSGFFFQLVEDLELWHYQSEALLTAALRDPDPRAQAAATVVLKQMQILGEVKAEQNRVHDVPVLSATGAGAGRRDVWICGECESDKDCKRGLACRAFETVIGGNRSGRVDAKLCVPQGRPAPTCPL